MTHSTLSDSGETIDTFIMKRKPTWESGTDEKGKTVKLKIPSKANVDVPFVGKIPARRVRFRASRAPGVQIDTGGIDPSMIPKAFSFRNVITGENRTLSELDVWMGFDTTIEAGKFYVNPLRSEASYLEEVEGNELQYVIVESYQHGKLFQARVKQTLIGRIRVVAVNAPDEIRRLRRMYNFFLRRERHGNSSQRI
jgi:hypothetical protein